MLGLGPAPPSSGQQAGCHLRRACWELPWASRSQALGYLAPTQLSFCHNPKFCLANVQFFLCPKGRAHRVCFLHTPSPSIATLTPNLTQGWASLLERALESPTDWSLSPRAVDKGTEEESGQGPAQGHTAARA